MSTLWPETPKHARPSLREGDSVVVIRVPREMAPWLEALGDDVTLNEGVMRVLRERWEQCQQ